MAFQTIREEKKLKKIANEVRKDIVKMTTAAASGHPGGSLGLADVYTTLYFSGVMKHNPSNPRWEERDRLIVSNGHICPVWYTVQAHSGYFPREELMSFRKLGSRLQGHPQKGTLPTIEVSTGSLGQGICVAVGYALGLKMLGNKNKVFCSVGDGELEEGATWEAAMAASHYKLENLIVFCDRNGLQQNGPTEQLMGLEPLAKKYEAFNWRVLEIDGHNIREIIEAFEKAREPVGRPTMILFKTTMGRGVKFMEGDHQWHGKALSPDKAQHALKLLDEIGKKN